MQPPSSRDLVRRASDIQNWRTVTFFLSLGVFLGGEGVAREGGNADN